MKILELFCSTKSISNAFKARGHEVFTVDWDVSFGATLCADIGDLSVKDVIELCGGVPDVIWASPDCTTYSVARIYKYRQAQGEFLVGKTEYAKECDRINAHVIKLIQELKPKYWFIENPRDAMRKAEFMRDLNEFRHTVTYCQYGENRMKPTDIWTNHPNPKFKPPCKNGDKCHEAAPRGSWTGTAAQGKNAKERSRIPSMLCEHIVDICEE